MSNTCNKTSNNKYFDCPARMDDARTFTDYRPSYTVDDMIRYSNNVMGSYDYRQFLIINATNIMNVNNNYTFDKVGCSSCTAPIIPFNETCDVNSEYSKCKITNTRGVGLNNVVTGFTPEYPSIVDNAGFNQIKNVQERFSNISNYADYEQFNNHKPKPRKDGHFVNEYYHNN